ncbi:MAG: hypothetical protein C4536_14955 [Actinobacteria bacterium]|nr:MAG: hypothetical protein C4536_14955 [Actinomycetota bacterium]
MAYCNKCGKELDEGDGFCHACGAAAVKPGEAAASGPPQAGSRLPVPPVAQTAQTAAPMSALAAPGYPAQAVGETPEEIAERRVKQRLELWWHLGSYVIVNVFLIIVWAITGAGYPWFVWVMVGWGIGIAFHVMHYFMTIHGEGRRQLMIQREMEKMQRKEDAVEEPKQTGEGTGE